MRRSVAVKIVFFPLIILSFALGVREISLALADRKVPQDLPQINTEHFDPSLFRLQSISEFVRYCDSLYGGREIRASDSERYAVIVSRTLRDRFYHGYSYYQLGDNTFARVFAPLIKKDLDAIVIPDDILKHPMAACSQQSIVGMEVFRKKGINVRKIGFFKNEYGGHFCFEAFFNGKWHFFDPDKEPRLSLMQSSHFPSISELVQDDSLLHNLYYNNENDWIKSLFITYTYGPVNKFPASHALIYQYLTKYLSYFSWLLLILLYFFVQKNFGYSAKKEKCVELQDSLMPEVRA